MQRFDEPGGSVGHQVEVGLVVVHDVLAVLGAGDQHGDVGQRQREDAHVPLDLAAVVHGDLVSAGLAPAVASAGRLDLQHLAIG